MLEVFKDWPWTSKIDRLKYISTVGVWSFEPLILENKIREIFSLSNPHKFSALNNPLYISS